MKKTNNKDKKEKLEDALRQNLLRRKVAPREENLKRETIINSERNKK